MNEAFQTSLQNKVPLQNLVKPLRESLIKSFREENEKSTGKEVEWYILTGRKEYSHLFRVRSKSGLQYVQKIFFAADLLEHLMNFSSFSDSDFDDDFNNYISEDNMPDALQPLVKHFFATYEDNEETVGKDKQEIAELRDNLKLEMFSFFVENPLEKHCYKWWSYFSQNVADNMDYVYYINNITEL